MFGSDGSRLSNTEYSYTYGNVSIGQIADTLYEYKIGTTDKFTFTYDDLARLTSRTLTTSETSKAENYTYKASEKYSGYTTTIVESMTDLSGVFHTYVYDANGNITEECVGDQTIRYEYDSQNRLTHYFDPIANKTRVYVYDDRGNILEVKYADYMSSEEWDAFVAEYGEDALPSTPYTYGDSTWADLLTNYNGTAITYDEIGNPLTWVGARNITLTWQNGRQLARYKQGTKTYDYTYNADGLRTNKTITQGSNVTKSTEYYIVNGQYIGEVTNVGGTEYVISYIYDENGSPAGINVDGSTYYFAKNLQGDVVAILDSTGSIIAKYVYDAWGNIVSITNGEGNVPSSTDVAKLNPFRYRGYMYDEETGLYYLRSRYYDPGVGRFINADGLVSTGTGLSGYNMFAYCNNNPVMLTDEFGYTPSLLPGISTSNIFATRNVKITMPQAMNRKYRPPYGIKYDVPLYNQGNTNLCWAYCQTMVEDYYSGVTSTENEAFEKAKNISISINGESLWNQGGIPKHQGHKQFISDIFDLYVLLQGGPLYGMYRNNYGEGHCIVITGVNIQRNLVYTNNPWGIAGIQNFDEFMKGFVGMGNENMRFEYIYIPWENK